MGSGLGSFAVLGSTKSSIISLNVMLNLNKVQDMPDPESSVCDMIVPSPDHNDNYRGINENYTCRSSPLTPREISGA